MRFFVLLIFCIKGPMTETVNSGSFTGTIALTYYFGFVTNGKGYYVCIKLLKKTNVLIGDALQNLYLLPSVLFRFWY